MIETLLIFIYTFIIRFLCSYNTPLFDDASIISDNSVFYMIGKGILEGKVLYKEMFDHKTPYIYFLNALCAIFKWHHIGLFICDVLFTFLCFYFMYKTFKMFLDNKYLTFIILIITSFFYNLLDINYGMLRTEGVTLGLLMPIIYITFKHFKDYNVDFKNSELFIIGFLTGLVFMFNPKPLLLILPLYFIMFVIYLFNKNSKKLVNFILIIVISVIFSIIPYIIYAIATNSLGDFLKAVIDVNLIYADPASNIYYSFASYKDFFLSYPFKYIVFIILILITFIMLIVFKYNTLIKGYLVSSLLILLLYTFAPMRHNPYYFLSFIPYIAAILVIMCKLYFEEFKKYVKPIIVYILLITFFIGDIYYGSIQIFYNTRNNFKYRNQINMILDNELGKDHGDLKFLSFGFNPEIYTLFDSKYNFKYQITPVIKYNLYKEPYEEQLSYIRDGIPDVVIFIKDAFMLHLGLQKYNEYLLALAKNYRQIGKVERKIKDEPYIIFIRNVDF